MTLRIHKWGRGGFSLLEMTVVLIIATILASAAVPQFINGYLVKAADKTALDISAIQEASRAYYVKNNAWPTSIIPVADQIPPQDLESNGFLPSNWNAVNPFGFSSAVPSNYLYNLTPNGASLIISTFVPNTNAQTIVENLLPLSGINKTTNIVSSSIPVPGSQTNSTLPPGTIVAWPGATAPTGFLLCDGSVYDNSSYPNLASVLGSTFGGDGVSTFGVPDLRGRTIVGLNQLTINDGTTRIWSTDNYSNNLGLPATYIVNQIGGIFGEEKHRQTLVEMAPHNHQETFQHIGYQAGGSTNSMGTGGNSPTGGFTLSAGGISDGTGLGAAANVVEPSIALSYIIKY